MSQTGDKTDLIPTLQHIFGKENVIVLDTPEAFDNLPPLAQLLGDGDDDAEGEDEDEDDSDDDEESDEDE